MKYKVLKNIPEHNKIQNKITLELWPEFILHDPVSNKYWGSLFESFGDYQFSLESKGEIIGTGNCLPFRWDDDFKALPEGGWDAILEKAVEDKRAGINPNALNGLQIAVNRNHQGKGVSSLVLKEMAAIAKEKGFQYVTIPVRPSLKSHYPLTPIDHYIQWRREDGLSFDPWLRVHERFGGKMIKVCHESMRVEGSISDWEQWTGLRFFESADYIIEGALNPVKINLEKDCGVYIEPNVWVIHEIKF